MGKSHYEFILRNKVYSFVLELLLLAGNITDAEPV